MFYFFCGGGGGCECELGLLVVVVVEVIHVVEVRFLFTNPRITLKSVFLFFFV